MTALSFAPVAERLGKLIPRLASTHDGEVVNTVAAIGRTLIGAGLDWHDLARRVSTPSFDDIMTVSTPTPSWSRPYQQPAPAHPSWSAEKEAEFQASRKPKKELPSWPTWGTLSHFGRLALIDAIKSSDVVPPKEAAVFAEFAQVYYRHQCGGTRKNINMFNRVSRKLWEAGWRQETRP